MRSGARADRRCGAAHRRRSRRMLVAHRTFGAARRRRFPFLERFVLDGEIIVCGWAVRPRLALTGLEPVKSSRGQPWPFRSAMSQRSAPISSSSTSWACKRYPLVLMLEPLFRCNLACAGCGKIDYPDHILNKRLSVEDASPRWTNAARRSSSSPAASRLLHKDLPQIVEGIIARAQIRHRLHQCAAARQEDRPLQAEPLFHLVDPSRWRQGDARPRGEPGRASTIAPSRRSSWRSPRASASPPTAPSSRTPIPSASPSSSTRRRRSASTA